MAFTRTAVERAMKVGCWTAVRKALGGG